MTARRKWAWPLVPVYAAVVGAKDWLREAGLLRAKHLTWPVVSVGSLAAGGAGKTPVVIALAGMLKERGWHVDVLSRGYGRRKPGVQQVIPGAEDAAAHFGDEPVMIAARLHIPVWVNRDRYDAGVQAEEAEQASQERKVHMLDDSFQHRRLGRTVDIVLVTAEDLNDALLPAGNRREPLSALRRADLVVVREEEMEIVEPRVKSLVQEGAMLWTVRRKLRFPAPLFVFGAGLRPVAFCAIARPEGFSAMLQDAGCGVADTIFFADHHAYAANDIERIVELATQLRATGLVTTEKDAVKLTAAMRTRLESIGPLMVVALDAEFVFPERVARELERRILPPVASEEPA